MIDLQQLAKVVRQARDLIAEEPALSGFLPGVEEVSGQADDLAAGRAQPVTLRSPCRVGKIPTRQLAERILEALAELPQTDGDEPREVVLAAARLYGNLHEVLTFAIVEQYPELMPRGDDYDDSGAEA